MKHYYARANEGLDLNTVYNIYIDAKNDWEAVKKLLVWCGEWENMENEAAKKLNKEELSDEEILKASMDIDHTPTFKDVEEYLQGNTDLGGGMYINYLDHGKKNILYVFNDEYDEVGYGDEEDEDGEVTAEEINL